MSPCILVTGAQGKVGHALMRQAPGHLRVSGLGSAELDICDPLAVEQCIARLQPRLIINAAAYTAVDKAESDTAQAYAVNAEGVANLAAVRHAMAPASCIFPPTMCSPATVRSLTAKMPR